MAARIIDPTTRKSLHGSTQVQGDQWLFDVLIDDIELTGASLEFQAASVPVGSETPATAIASSGSGITEVSNTGFVLHAQIKIDNAAAGANIAPAGEIEMFYELTLTRNAPTKAPLKQTLFRRDRNSFKLIAGVT